jgi:hypothetical protein
MSWKNLRVAGLVGLALAAFIALLFVREPFGHKLVVKAYFSNAMSLRNGAPVRLAGVDVGSVRSVRARPELKEAPAEVVMVLTPAYELKIPNDSTVSLATTGVLGSTYVEIDVAHASGAPIGSNVLSYMNGGIHRFHGGMRLKWGFVVTLNFFGRTRQKLESIAAVDCNKRGRRQCLLCDELA